MLVKGVTRSGGFLSKIAPASPNMLGGMLLGTAAVCQGDYCLHVRPLDPAMSLFVERHSADMGACHGGVW